jgi:hypothetical protein
MGGPRRSAISILSLHLKFVDCQWTTILSVLSRGRGRAKPPSVAGTQLFRHFRHVLRIRIVESFLG